MKAFTHRAHVLGILGVTILLNACGSDVPAGPPGTELRRGSGGARAVGGQGSGGSTPAGGRQGTGDPGLGGAGRSAGGVAGGGGGVSGAGAGGGGQGGSGGVGGSIGDGGHASGGAGGLGAGGGGAKETGGAGGRNEAGVGDACGGSTANARPCAKGLFCEGSFPELACVADVGGTCQSKPEGCTAVYAPVCGCDRKTYSSDCVRRGAGVSKLSDGECPKDGGSGGSGDNGGSGGTKGDGGRDGHQGSLGDACGGFAANVRGCAKGLFCEGPFPDLACEPDVGGTCQEAPNGCTKDYQPVCGCDCKTYGNDCTRRAAGVSKRADGECAAVKGC